MSLRMHKFILLGATLLSACASAPEGVLPLPPVARFAWFSYTGSDSIYERLRARPGEYSNPILEGFYPDPSITRSGDDYYLVTSSFAYYPGVPIFRSRDLVNWTQIGYVLDRPSQLKLDSAGISRGIFAPTIRYHDGVFYMITTNVSAGGNFYVTANDPRGPWSEPVWLGFDGIDPSLFFDDDGRAYVVNNGPPIGPPLYEGHRALWLQELDAKAGKLIGPRRLIVNGGTDISRHPIWIEAPHILKAKGTYWLIAAEGGTGDQHSEVVFRSSSVWGPWEPYPGNPILTQRHLDPARPAPITSTGHADFVQSPTGAWWAVFLGTRPYRDDTYNTGRETFMLPVDWSGEWPVILAGRQTVPYVVKAPALPPQPPAPVPTSGNFTVRDDFDGPAPAPYWQMMRTPREPAWYDLSSRPGWLTLQARPEALGGRGQPTFLGRRQQHAFASASTEIVFTPTVGGDFAGLAAFQNETHYYALGVALDGDHPAVRLVKRAGNQASAEGDVVASAPVKLRPGHPLRLRIDARGDVYDFFYGVDEGEWQPLLRGADGTILSTKVAGGFVGSFFGLFAVSGQR